MTDITITKQDEVWMRVSCTEKYMEMDIADRFQFRSPNAHFDPRVKFGKWDGIIRLYNRKTKRMYVGLLYKLLEFCEKQDFGVYVDPSLVPTDSLSKEDLDGIVEFVKPHSNGNPVTLYDYQEEAIMHMMTMDRSTCLAATSSGKSLILYMLVRIYQLLDEMKGKKIFICVPSTSLVEQIYSDFDDYSTFEGSDWNIQKYVQKMSGDYKNKSVDMPIIITTWQTMEKLPQFVYDEIGAIFVDECHVCKADVLKKILESCTSTPFRHGLTGTLDGTECLHGDTLVRMSNNELVKIKDIKAGDTVFTLNETNKKKEYKRVIKTHKNLSVSNNQKRLKITLENSKTIIVTGNHKLMTTNYIWKRADELSTTDELLDI